MLFISHEKWIFRSTLLSRCYKGIKSPNFEFWLVEERGRPRQRETGQKSQLQSLWWDGQARLPCASHKLYYQLRRFYDSSRVSWKKPTQVNQRERWVLLYGFSSIHLAIQPIWVCCMDSYWRVSIWCQQRRGSRIYVNSLKSLVNPFEAYNCRSHRRVWKALTTPQNIYVITKNHYFLIESVIRYIRNSFK